MSSTQPTVTIESTLNGTVDGIVPAKGTRPVLPDLPTSTHDKVRILDISEHKEAAKSLALSFKEDHVIKYFFFEDMTESWTQKTYGIHVKMMEYITYAHCLNGLVTTVGPNYDSVALW